MSLPQLAQQVRAQGRGPDTQLVHMAPSEVAGLQSLAQSMGGSLTTNPQTGLPEAGFLSDILPYIAAAAAIYFTAGAAAPAVLGAAGTAGTAGAGLTAGELAATEAGLTAGELAATEAGLTVGTAIPTATTTTVPAAAIPTATTTTAPAAASSWDKWAGYGARGLQAAKSAGLLDNRQAQYAPITPAPGYSPASVDTPEGGIQMAAPRWNSGPTQAPIPGSQRAVDQELARRRAYAEQGWDSFGAPARFAAGGIAQGMESGGFVVPADVVSAVGNGSTDAGLRALASLGAEPIRGAGDGQSDDIQTNIDGARPARVADGEAYIAPEKVAHLGGGNHSNGAKRLYAMLDRVRTQAHGTTKQQRPINFDRIMA